MIPPSKLNRLRKLLKDSEQIWESDSDRTKSNLLRWRKNVALALREVTGNEYVVEHWAELMSFGDTLSNRLSLDEWRQNKEKHNIAITWLDEFINDQRELPGGEEPRKWESYTGKTAPLSKKHVVFIGHGKSPIWRELKDFIQDTLRLKWNEFNRDSAAGLATTERLSQMLDSASFAFLVMTAEDKHSDGTAHARENVVHEAGLFQGRLGFRKAIILIEEGCEEFSNISGLTQIRFPEGDILARTEEVRRVLKREKIL